MANLPLLLPSAIIFALKLLLMKKWLLLLVLAVVGVLTWYLFVTRKKAKDETPKQQPIAVSKHSDEFNQSMNKVLGSYYALTNNFVNWDAAAINNNAAQLKKDLQQAKFEEIKKDTLIHQTASTYLDAMNAELGTIIQSADIAEKRRALNNFSDNMYNLIRTIRYDRAKVYLQECPMAFNDEEPGVWLSGTDSIRNPYLGLHHPKYKSGMLECGSTKETLDFTSR